MSKWGYLGLDLGGTGAKAGVYDSSGKALSMARAACRPTTTAEGHIEIPIEDIYLAARDATREAIAAAGVRIRALAISSQGQTFVSLDRSNTPLHPAILWYDGRAVDQAERLRGAVTKANPEQIPLIEPIATAPKIMWLREKFPEMMSQAHRYLLLPEYISYRLTEEAVTDPSTAASTALYAEDAPGYCQEALAAAGIKEGQLARIESWGKPIAKVITNTAEEWGITSDTLLAVGTNDQYAGALGAGNCRPGIVTETSGSCLSLVTLTDRQLSRVAKALLVGRFPIPRYQFVMAYSMTAGLVIDWFNREFQPGKKPAELEGMAASAPIGSNGVAFLPHFEGMVCPEPNPSARGFICGLSLSNSLSDMYRALFESLSFCLREDLELLIGCGLKPDVIRSIGGGAKSDFWMQMKSDVIGLPVERPVVTEAATFGAAMLAAFAAGEFESLEQCSEAFYRVNRVFEPNMNNHELYEEPYRRYRDLCGKVYGIAK